MTNVTRNAHNKHNKVFDMKKMPYEIVATTVRGEERAVGAVRAHETQYVENA